MQTFNVAQELAQFLGKETCISQDRPGFIVNRVLMPMINEAFYTLMEVGTSSTMPLHPTKHHKDRNPCTALQSSLLPCVHTLRVIRPCRVLVLCGSLLVWPDWITRASSAPPLYHLGFILMQGVGSAEDIDRGMKLGTNQPMGPLQLADFIGGHTRCCSHQRLHFALHCMPKDGSRCTCNCSMTQRLQWLAQGSIVGTLIEQFVTQRVRYTSIGYP